MKSIRTISIITHITLFGKQSVRKLEKDLGIEKSSVHRYLQVIKEMCSIVDVWWFWASESLEPFNLSSSQRTWVTEIMFPTIYWYRQADKTDNPRLKAEYRESWEAACCVLKSSMAEVGVSNGDLDRWSSRADWICRYFHRRSSAVEERNGSLAQMYHIYSLKGVLSPIKLYSLS